LSKKNRHKSAEKKHQEIYEIYCALTEIYSQQGRRIEEVQTETGYSRSAIYQIIKEYKEKK